LLGSWGIVMGVSCFGFQKVGQGSYGCACDVGRDLKHTLQQAARNLPSKVLDRFLFRSLTLQLVEAQRESRYRGHGG
jgi:hypothetical protein